MGSFDCTDDASQGSHFQVEEWNFTLALLTGKAARRVSHGASTPALSAHVQQTIYAVKDPDDYESKFQGFWGPEMKRRVVGSPLSYLVEKSERGWELAGWLGSEYPMYRCLAYDGSTRCLHDRELH